MKVFYPHRLVPTPVGMMEYIEMMGADTESHSQTLREALGTLRKRGGRIVGAKEIKDNRRTQTRESTKQVT